MSSHIIFWNDKQPYAAINLHFGTDLDKVEEFARFLAQFSSAGVKEIGITVTRKLDIPAPACADPMGTDYYADVMVRRLSNRKLYSVAIPSPRLEIFELITGEGKRVTEAIGEEIAIKYGEMLAGDANFQFHWGKLAGGI